MKEPADRLHWQQMQNEVERNLPIFRRVIRFRGYQKIERASGAFGQGFLRLEIKDPTEPLIGKKGANGKDDNVALQMLDVFGLLPSVVGIAVVAALDAHFAS